MSVWIPGRTFFLVLGSYRKEQGWTRCVGSNEKVHRREEIWVFVVVVDSPGNGEKRRQIPTGLLL